MRALLLGLLIAGCAHDKPTPAPVTTASAPDPLQERGAALFDAAMHDDRARLKTLVDWQRYRVVVAAFKSRDEMAAARALAEIDSDPQPTEQYVEGQVVLVANHLSTFASGTLPPQISQIMDYAAEGNWPAPERLSPSRARLVRLAIAALFGAREVIYDNAIALDFIKGQLVYTHPAKVLAR
jgi:hypothetical protein